MKSFLTKINNWGGVIAALLLLPALPAKAFTVHDLVKENGNYAIQTAYFSKKDLNPEVDQIKYQYPDGFYGYGSGCHFEYVKDRWGENSEYYVKLVGLKIAPSTTSAWEGDMVERDFYFALANKRSGSNPYWDSTDNGDYIILYNEDHYVNPYIDWDEFSGINNTSTAVCTSGDYALAPLLNATRAGLESQLDYYNYGYIHHFYTYKLLTSADSKDANDKGAIAWAGKITRDSQGNIRIDFENGVLAMPTGYTRINAFGAFNKIANTYIHDTKNVMDRMTLEIYKPDGTFECTQYNFPYLGSKYNTSGNKISNKIKIKKNADGSTGIINPMGGGYAQMPGTLGGARYYPTEWKASMKNGVLVFELEQYVAASYPKEYALEYKSRVPLLNCTHRDYPLQLALLTNFPYTDYTFDDTQVTGTIISGKGIEHRKGKTGSFWVNPGDCRTYIKGITASIDGMFAAVNNDNGFRSTPAWGDGVFSLDELDVTLDADISHCALGYSDTQLWPKVTLQINGNDTYVKSYTLYMIPYDNVAGNHPSQGGDIFKDEDGVSGAFEVITLPADKAESLGDGTYPKYIYLDLLFDKANMSPEQIDPNNKYYFFVKANYVDNIELSTDASAIVPLASNILDGTFHGFTTADEVTGAQDIESVGFIVEASRNMLTVSGAQLPVNIYTADGRMVYSGSNAALNVARGIYLVKSGNIVKKVFVP